MNPRIIRRTTADTDTPIMDHLVVITFDSPGVAVEEVGVLVMTVDGVAVVVVVDSITLGSHSPLGSLASCTQFPLQQKPLLPFH